MPDRRPFLAPLSHQSFRDIWFASLASNLGGLIQAVGAAWMMTSISTSENMVALVQSSTTLPIMLFSVLAGAIADNFDRRRVMLAAQIFMLVVSALLSAATYFGLITPWVLLGFTFLIGCGTALNNPSWQASVGDMVPRIDLPGAVSLNSVGFNITRSAGPAIGGAIVAAGGAAAAFAANTVSYLALIVAILRWKQTGEKAKLPREQLGPAIAAGLRYASMSPNLLKVYLRSFLFGLSAVAILALLPVVARDVIKGGPFTFGIMLGFFGLGAIGGAFVSARLRERFSSEDIVRIAFAVFALAEAILAISENVFIDGLALIMAGGCWVIALSLFNTIVQLSSPRWVVGRTLSLYQTSTFGGMAAGSWLWGMLAETHGIPFALSIAAACMGAGVIIGLVMPMPAFASLNLDPLNRFREPNLQLNIMPRSGPIVVHITYEIADENLGAFLTLMSERRRIRIRDGARNWTLMRDVERAEVWTESYHSPTWMDYVRHVQRRTEADADNLDQLWALHRGDGPPVARRMIERQTIPRADDIFHQAHIEPH